MAVASGGGFAHDLSPAGGACRVERKNGTFSVSQAFQPDVWTFGEYKSGWKA